MKQFLLVKRPISWLITTLLSILILSPIITSAQCTSEYVIGDRTGLPNTQDQYYFNIDAIERKMLNNECVETNRTFIATCSEFDVNAPNTGQEMLLKKYDELDILKDLNTPNEIALAATRIGYIIDNYIFAYDAVEVIHAFTYTNRSPYIFENWAHTDLGRNGIYFTKQYIYMDVLNNVTEINHELASKVNFYVTKNGERRQTLVEWPTVSYNCNNLEVSLNDTSICEEAILTPEYNYDIAKGFDNHHVLGQCYYGINPESATLVDGYYATLNSKGSYITLDLGKVYPANTAFLVRATGSGGTTFQVDGSLYPDSQWYQFGRNRTNSATGIDNADLNFKSTTPFRYVRVKNISGGGVYLDGITTVDEGKAPTFLWSTGETTESIVVTQPDNYAVTIKTYLYSTTNNRYEVYCTKTAYSKVAQAMCEINPFASNNESTQNQPGPVTQLVITEDDGDGVDYATNASLIPSTFSFVNPYEVYPSATDTDGDGVSDSDEGRVNFANTITYNNPYSFTGSFVNVTNINNAIDSNVDSYSTFNTNSAAYYIFNQSLPVGTQITLKVKNPSGKSENFSVSTGTSEANTDVNAGTTYNTTNVGEWEYITHIIKAGESGNYIKISTNTAGNQLWVADATIIETTISTADVDTDNDSIPDYLDLDSDGDNSLDTIDPARTDSSIYSVYYSSTYIDSNNDGYIEEILIANQGTWTFANNDEVTFTPITGFTNDPTSVFYKIKDDNGNVSNNARITVDYLAVTTDDESLNNVIGSTLIIDAIANDTTGDTINPKSLNFIYNNIPNSQGTDTYGDGDIDKVIVLGEGTWSVNDSGIVTFIPENGFTGNPTPIQYTVKDDENSISNPSSITVTYLSNNSTIANNDTNQTPENVPVNGNVLWNDKDPESDTQTLTNLFGDLNGDGLINETFPIGNSATLYGKDDNGVITIAGTIIVNTDGNYVYTPAENFSGTVSISYTITDDNTVPATDTAFLVIDVIGDINGLFLPVAKDDIYVMEPGQPITMPVLINDSDVDGNIVPSTVSLIQNPNTTVTGILLDNENNIIRVIVANEGIWDVDEITGEVIFTPENGFVGNPSPIDYVVSDNDGLTDTATITISTGTIDANEMAASDDSNIGYAGETLTNTSANGNNLLDNDIDPDGSTGTPTITQAYADTNGDGLYDDRLTLGSSSTVYGLDASGNTVVAGNVVVNNDGTYTYESNPNFVGTTLIAYTVCDNDTNNACANATLELTTIKPAGAISGMVSNDINGDGTGNAGIENTTIELFEDVDADGFYSSGDNLIATTKTDANGAYIFNGLTPGDYVIVQTQPSGYYNGKDSDDIVDSADDTDFNVNKLDNQLSVNLVINESDSGNNFVETQAEFSINGTIFYDENGLDNGIIDGIPFVPRPTAFAVLLNELDEVIATNEINGQFDTNPGQYIFENIPAGITYRVILSSFEPAVGTSLTYSSLPLYYVSTGEFIGTGAGSDGEVDGKSAYFILNENIINNNFGVRYFKPGTRD